MYLRIVTLAQDRIVLDSGDGPRVFGQSMSTARHAAASLACSIGSGMGDVVAVIVVDRDFEELSHDWVALGMNPINEITPEAVRTTHETGWLRRADKPGTILILYDREDIEYCMTLSDRCFIVSSTIREFADSPALLEERAQSMAECVVTAWVSSLRIQIFHDRWLNLMVERTARVLADFNQVGDESVHLLTTVPGS